MEEKSAKTESHHYHKTYDGDKALTNPAPNRHVEVATDTRRVTALAHAFRTQGLGWGGGGGGGGGGQLIGFEKWARRPTRQVQRSGAPNEIFMPLCASSKQRASPLGPKAGLG